MALSLIHATAQTGVISAADMATDMTAIENAVNNADGALLDNGSVPNAALENNSYEVILTLPAVDITGSNSAVVPFPDPTDGPYTLEALEWYVTDGGASNAVFVFESGTVSGGSFSATTTHDTVTMTVSSGSAGVGRETFFTAANLPASNSSRLLRARISTTSAGGGDLTVSAKFKKELRI